MNAGIYVTSYCAKNSTNYLTVATFVYSFIYLQVSSNIDNGWYYDSFVAKYLSNF